MQFQTDKPIYIQISDLVMEKILKGDWGPEEKILSVRELGASIEVNPNTVMRAYDLLQQDEIIFNKRGLGFFVAKKAPEIISRIKKQHFLKTAVPQFFQSAKLLNISIEELIDLYKAY